MKKNISLAISMIIVVLLFGCSNSSTNSENGYKTPTSVISSPTLNTDEELFTDAEPQIIGNISDSGTCGDNLTWNLTDDGVLYIIGTGQMDEIKWGTNWQNNFTTQMITSIVIGDGVESISKRAFARCSNLTEVSIGKGVTNIDSAAFSSCKSLKSIEIPEGVTEIKQETFISCESLSNVLFHDNIEEIGDNAFRCCYALTSVTIPDSVTKLGEDVFYECTNLTDVILGNNITEIKDFAFANCEKLKNIFIPDSVTAIGALKSVYIPITMDYFGKNVFYFDEASVSEIYYEGNESEWAAISGTDDFYLKDKTIHYNAY